MSYSGIALAMGTGTCSTYYLSHRFHWSGNRADPPSDSGHAKHIKIQLEVRTLGGSMKGMLLRYLPLLINFTAPRVYPCRKEDGKKSIYALIDPLTTTTKRQACVSSNPALEIGMFHLSVIMSKYQGARTLVGQKTGLNLQTLS